MPGPTAINHGLPHIIPHSVRYTNVTTLRFRSGTEFTCRHALHHRHHTSHHPATISHRQPSTSTLRPSLGRTKETHVRLGACVRQSRNGRCLKSRFSSHGIQGLLKIVRSQSARETVSDSDFQLRISTPRRLESDRATHSEARIARFDARLCKGDGAGIQVAKHWLAFVSCTFVQGLRILLFVGSCVGTKESRDVQIVVLLE